MKKLLIAVAVATALVGITPVFANTEDDFSTLNGVDSESLSDNELANVEAKGNFYAGQCTWFVDAVVRGSYKSNLGLTGWGSAYAKSGVPWQGNAVDWYKNAKAAGFAESRTPLQGSIVVYNNSYGKYGHVAYVTSVQGSKFTVKEMNYTGPYAISTRTDNIVTSSAKISGFIYGR